MKSFLHINLQVEDKHSRGKLLAQKWSDFLCLSLRLSSRLIIATASTALLKYTSILKEVISLASS